MISHTAALALRGMSGPGPLGSRLTCDCSLCLLWRRLGEEVHLGHQSEAFRAVALEELGRAFDRCLGCREAHRLELWDPLAGGSRDLPGHQEVTEEAPERGSRKSRSRRRQKREAKKGEESEETKAARKRQEQERAKSRSRRRTRSKKELSSEHRAPDASSSASLGSKGKNSGSTSHHRRSLVKEELSEKERNKEPTEAVRGEVSPGRERGSGESEVRASCPSRASGVRLRSAPSVAPRAAVEEPHRAEEEPPPGRWSLHERPAEPREPPRPFRPPEPRGPPPGWVGERGREGPRSKGVVRRERQADILLHGPDPKRKADREARHR